MICPSKRIGMNVKTNHVPFILFANNVIMESCLPGKIDGMFPCKGSDADFESADDGCQIVGLGSETVGLWSMH